MVVATSEPLDDDLAARIARHRAERPAWPTVEEPLDLGARAGAVDGDGARDRRLPDVWVSNLMQRGDSDAAIEAQSAAVAPTWPPAAARRRSS